MLMVNEVKGSSEWAISVHTFFSHHQTQVQDNKKEEKSPLLAYSLAHSSFNQGSRVRFLASLGIVNLFGAGMPGEYYW